MFLILNEKKQVVHEFGSKRFTEEISDQAAKTALSNWLLENNRINTHLLVRVVAAGRVSIETAVKFLEDTIP